MAKGPPPTIERTTDPDGTPIVRVSLHGKGHAELEAEAFDTLMAFGFSPWMHVAERRGNGKIVSREVCTHRGANARYGVNRALLMCGPGEGCAHLDGNPFNLRLANLKKVQSRHDTDPWMGSGYGSRRLAEIEGRSLSAAEKHAPDVRMRWLQQALISR